MQKTPKLKKTQKTKPRAISQSHIQFRGTKPNPKHLRSDTEASRSPHAATPITLLVRFIKRAKPPFNAYYTCSLTHPANFRVVCSSIDRFEVLTHFLKLPSMNASCFCTRRSYFPAAKKSLLMSSLSFSCMAQRMASGNRLNFR